MTAAGASDEQLMLRFARGDAAAFEALYRRHEARVFRYLYRNTRSHALADDLMQEVWFAVARAAGAYQPTARFTTWLYTLAHNRMVDAFRAARPQQSLDTVDGSVGERGAAGADGADRAPSAAPLIADRRAEPPAVAQADAEAAALRAAVEQLPPEQRQAFLLQAEAELSVEDIATATGASFETVKSRLRYARSKLRRLLLEYA